MPTLLRTDAETASPIRCILSDVDGVMTDGSIWYDTQLIEAKRFHVRDGLAIKLWLRSGFEFGIVTSRNSPIVAHRAAELGITHVEQGCLDKRVTVDGVLERLGYTLRETCYIGDDLPDIGVMRRVGLAVAPSDASSDTREAAHWVLRQEGGSGAVRELIERLLRAKDRWAEHVRD